MGSGHVGVATVARTGYSWGEQDSTPRYTPGVIHWEGPKAYIYYKSLDANIDGAPMYKTGTAGDALILQPVAVGTGAKVIGVAVSDVASGYYGWAQVYGPMTYVHKLTAYTVYSNSYVIGVPDSYGARSQTEASNTYVAGVFGYCIDAADIGTAASYFQAFINCL
jgi:hypothetical protein